MRQRDFRKMSGMTQTDFARRIGVHAITVCRWEKDTIPSLRMMQRIVELFPEIRPEDYFDTVRECNEA